MLISKLVLKRLVVAKTIQKYLHTTEINKHIACGFSIFVKSTHNKSKNKQYTCRDCEELSHVNVLFFSFQEYSNIRINRSLKEWKF